VRVNVTVSTGGSLAAAAQAGDPALVVRELGEVPDLRAASELLGQVWGVGSGAPPVGPELLRGLTHAGNYVAGAFRDGSLVGVAVGFLGGAGDDLFLHSQITGVVAGLRGRSVGLALKQHQRAWALARDVTTISWTFDPLVRRNGWFNLNKLGALATRYLEDFYGEVDDAFNGRDKTDRCVVTWRLDSDRAQQAAAGALEPPAGAGAARLLDEDSAGLPLTGPLEGDALLVRVPEDIVELRTSDPERATRWRFAVRETLGAALAGGFVATGMTADGCYLLERR
jgi:predicted GNAT superfamily acetyltransferase